MSPMSEFVQSFHQLTSSIFTPLIQFLQLKYRINNQAQTAFTANPTTMLVSISSFLVYYLLHIVLLRSRRPGRFAAVLERFIVWSGYAAVAGLAAAVFPDGASPFLYAIFGSLSAGEVLYMCNEKLVTKDEIEIKDDNVIGIEEEVKDEEGSKFEVYRKRVYQCLKHLRFWRVAKVFQKQVPPIPT